jgi:hypothetical protein
LPRWAVRDAGVAAGREAIRAVALAGGEVASPIRTGIGHAVAAAERLALLAAVYATAGHSDAGYAEGGARRTNALAVRGVEGASVTAAKLKGVASVLPGLILAQHRICLAGAAAGTELRIGVKYRVGRAL